MTTARANLRIELDRVAKDLGAIENEAERALRDAVMYAGRRVRTRATRSIHSRMKVAAGRQASVRRRLRLYNKRMPKGHRASVWLGAIGIGAEVYYTKGQARKAFKEQRANNRKGPGKVKHPGPRGATIPRSFWMDAHGYNDPIAFRRTGSGRKSFERAHIPFLKDAGPHLVESGIGAEHEVLIEFERRLRVLVAQRHRGGSSGRGRRR